MRLDCHNKTPLNFPLVLTVYMTLAYQGQVWLASFGERFLSLLAAQTQVAARRAPVGC